MLHELLLALHGYPGSIFVERDKKIKVVKGLPFLHPSEEILLDKLCFLGTSYKHLQEFITQHKYDTEEPDDLYGLYIRAFCNGLDKVLDPYRDELLKVEKEILEDPHIPLTHLLKLEEHGLLFQILSTVVSQLKKKKAHGCSVLELVYSQSSSGIPMVEKSMNKILHICHGVMYKQLIGWMLHGILLDPYKEFFVQQEECENDQSQHDHSSSSITEANHLVKGQQSKDVSILISQKRCILKPNLLPSYIPSHVAEKILFVGQSVSLFGQSHKQEEMVNFSDSAFRKREDEFGRHLLELQQNNRFSLSKFETAIDEMRNCAAEHLWQVVVEDANLLAHLRIIKDFYLLGRGELFLAFIDHANSFMRVPVTVTTEHDANMAFQLSARQVLLGDDTVAEKFYVTSQAKNKKHPDIYMENLSKAKLETGWSTVGLIYEVPWPLHILLTPLVLDRYNTIFRFLLAVRKVQLELHQCWATQMCNKGVGRESTSMPLWQLRSHMTFLIDNLQYYLQVDVLESQFATLVEKIKVVKDFEAIQQAHDYFLTSIISQCFLQLKPAYHCLQEILDLCLSFCGLMTRVQDSLSQREMTQLGNLTVNFQRQTSLLFRVLSGVRSHQVSPYLAQLLLRIDYNKYLSSCGGHLGGADTFLHGNRKMQKTTFV